MPTTTALGSPIEPGAIEVVDGDTIRAGGRTFRLVGFDTPETGNRARCESERTLAAAASRRLRHLIAAGGLDLERVACSCRPGTRVTSACNHGRLCGTLWARGRDVGLILISEGLARPFACGPQSCPPQQGWCVQLERIRSGGLHRSPDPLNILSKRQLTCPLLARDARASVLIKYQRKSRWRVMVAVQCRAQVVSR
jgi:hypothetical protein